MVELSVGASAFAHGVHYGVVGFGVLGLFALLAPRLAGTAPPDVAADEHDLRVRAVHEQIASGSLGLRPTAVPTRPVAVVRTTSNLLPVAVVGSAAAAGVHAGVGPAHLTTQPLVGLFFAGCALAQIGWSVTMVLRPSRALLYAAVIGNTAVLTLWLVSRTTGVAGHPPEPFGPWDLTCAAWEITTVLAAARLLRNHDPAARLRLPPWHRWPASARFWLLGSALVLGLLAMSGAPA